MKKQFLNKKVNVLLLSKVYGLGSRFDTKSVNVGYFLNYLLPNKLAVRMDEKVLNFINSVKVKEQERLAKLNETVNKLNGQALYFARTADKKGSVFSSISRNEIISYLQNDYGISPSKHDVEIPEIKSYGIYNFNVTIGNSLSSKMVLVVSGSIEDAKALLKASNKGVESEGK